MSDEKPKPTNPLSSKRALEARRRFLRSIVLGAAVLCISGVGYVPVARAWRVRMRPPGALEESDFLSSCIKCGQCVQVCPVDAIKLDDIDNGFGVGVPYIDSRKQACDFSCDAVQCVLACPTGALVYRKPSFMPFRREMRVANPPILLAKKDSPEPTLNLRERSGLAVLLRPEKCLARQGKGIKGPARGQAFEGKMRFMEVDRWKPILLRDHPYDLELCNLCVRTCPIEGAISMETVIEKGFAIKTPVVHEPCLGCGVCEMVCPPDLAAIVVEARKGWSES